MSLAIRISAFAVCLLVASAPLARGGEDDDRAVDTQDAPPVEMTALEQQFSDTLTNATLIGRFTVRGDDEPPAEERYVISKVTKMKGDLWLFAARIQFGKNDVTIPLVLTVKWAGDTPVITLTDMKVPGLGTYTARVLIYRDEYAGTWSGGDHGGALFGRIEREKPAEPAPPAR